MLGQWLIRDRAGEPLLARVQDELFVLAFSSAARATGARALLGAEGVPFLIVAANLKDVVSSARAAGAHGFILDYDAERTMFSSAHPLPEASSPAA